MVILLRHINAALPHSFAVIATHLGYCSASGHDVDTGDAEPIRQPPRRPPLSARQAEEDILNEMLKTGVIEPAGHLQPFVFRW